MTPHDAAPDEHPWYLGLQPDPAANGRAADAFVALEALEALGATMIAVHADTVPSLTDVVSGCGYVGWTIAIPGSVARRTIEDIAATARAGYRTTLTPGHPLPPAAARA